MQNVMQSGPCARSLQIDYDDEVSVRAVQWLYDQARKQDRQPFMLTVSFTSPHDPYVALPEFWDLYRDEEIDLPEVGPIPLDRMDRHSARIHEHYSVGDAVVTDEVIRRTRHGYYASISYVDDKVATLMATLRRAGLDEDTIVIFTSDHGDMMGERGLYYKKSFYEWSARVPLICHAPGLYRPHRPATPVSLVDILPTLHEMSGGRPGDILEADGRSLVGLLEQRPVSSRPVAGEFLAEGVYEPTFMLRDQRYKLHYSEVDPPLLFDLDADPQELNDLAKDAAHAEKLAELTSIAEGLWNAGEIKADILRDQNRRRLVERAHAIGRRPVWDYQPFTDESRQWVRAGAWTVDVEAEAHLGLQPRGTG
jgi:choline-sulfatase